MHKNIFGRQFKRDANERKALFKGLMNSLVIHERIETTEEKAKAIRSSIEKLVTKAKQGATAERLLIPYLNEQATKKMISEIGPRFASRPGGYVRITKMGNRLKDNASMAVMEFVEKSAKTVAQSSKAKKTQQKSEKVETTAEIKTKAVKNVKDTKNVKTEKPKKTAEIKAMKTQQKKGGSK